MVFGVVFPKMHHVAHEAWEQLLRKEFCGRESLGKVVSGSVAETDCALISSWLRRHPVISIFVSLYQTWCFLNLFDFGEKRKLLLAIRRPPFNIYKRTSFVFTFPACCPSRATTRFALEMFTGLRWGPSLDVTVTQDGPIIIAHLLASVIG